MLPLYNHVLLLFVGTRWITHKINAMQLVVDKYGIYLQHLQNMAEDKSFKSVDRQKFKGWLTRWQKARIPLLSCLFIEVLSPAKALSLAFQEENIDTVSSISRIEAAKKQLKRLERKDACDLPTVKRFLDKVTNENGEYLYQDVCLRSFESAKESLQKIKEDMLAKVTASLQDRLEVAENEFVISAATVLNTEGWERFDENGEEDVIFADGCLTELYEHFKEPLSNAGLKGSFFIVPLFFDFIAHELG